MTQKEFNLIQLNEIDIHKWIESQKAGYDLGDQAILDWINNHARIFREENLHLFENNN
jgi:hypothetical protein